LNHQDLIQACLPEWQAYTQHKFVRQLAGGELCQQAYLHYLKQDFLFLKQYSRAFALAIYKTQSLEEMRMGLAPLQALLNEEIAHHVSYCEKLGITEQEMEQEAEAFGTVAYTRYVLDTGMSGDLTALYVALAPCSIGYAEIGAQLASDKQTCRDNNPYQSWIDMYSGQEFQSGAETSIHQLNNRLSAIKVDSEQGRRLCDIFRTATRMEIAFWQQGLDAAKS